METDALQDLILMSKFVSFVLRHDPDSIGLVLDSGGWASVAELLHRAKQAGYSLNAESLQEVIDQSDKRRFSLSSDGKRIRANHGHSVPIELGIASSAPVEFLFHGTAARNIGSIRALGLIRGERQYVHLSATEARATKVGQRHGKPVVLVVRAATMHRDGSEFFLSANGVWLTRHVPPCFIDFPK